MGRAPRHDKTYYATTMANWPRWEKLSGDVEADVCVIGGGLAGLTVAREMIGRGHAVTLLEADAVAAHASGRNGGFVSGGFALPVAGIEKRIGRSAAQEIWALSCDGVRYVHDAVSTLQTPGIIAGRGKLKVWRVDDAEAVLRQADLMNTYYGTDYSVWERLKVREHLRTDCYYHALYDRRGFHINPLLYARALAHDAWRQGVNIYEASRALSLRPVQGGWHVVTAHGLVRSAHVVLCINATRQGIYRPLQRAILPVATFVTASEVMTEKLRQSIRFKGCIADQRRAGDYFRIFPDGPHERLIWGGRMTTNTSIPADLTRRLGKDIQSVFPQLGYFQMTHTWGGVMGYAVHRMPIIGQLKEGLWAATAFGGHGLNTTAMAGSLIAAAIAEGDDRWRLFSPFAARWGGGAFGRLATRITYWFMQRRDLRDERATRRRQAQGVLTSG